MKIHVSELEGRALDYAVAMAIGYRIADTSEYSSRIYFIVPDHGYMPLDDFFPSGDWGQCGPLIDEYNIWLFGLIYSDDEWKADVVGDDVIAAYGETPQIATCRAVVLAKLGDEVEIPDELVTK